MTKILRGAPVAAKIEEELERKIEKLKSKEIKAKLAMVRLGEDSDDINYERSIVRKCEDLGIETVGIVKDIDIPTEEFLEIVEELNNDEDIAGILLLSMLATRDDQETIRRAISPEKDIDGIHPLNLEKIFRGDLSGLGPCPAKAAVEILDHYGVDLVGKNVIVINRSMVIGKPLSMMLIERDSTVTMAHSKTEDLKSLTKKSDIVITAIGAAKFFDRSYFKEDAVVIDLGIDFDKDGKLSGDIDFDDVVDNVAMITPVPGGIGSITTSILLEQNIDSAIKRRL